MWDLTDSKKDTEKTNQHINTYKRKQQQFIWASAWVLIHRTGVRHELHSLPAHPFGCWTNILEIFSVISLVVFLMCHAKLVTCRTCGTGEVERVSHSHSMSLRVSLQSVPAAEEKPSGSIEIPPNLTASRLDDTGGPLAPWLTPTVGCTSVSLAAVSQLSGLRCDRGGIIDRQSPSSCLLASTVCRAFP